jgi:RNA-directed DNA polymerase
VVYADLSKYFDTIPHRELMLSIARRIVDPDMLWLVKQWLKAPVETTDGGGKRRMEGGRATMRGRPQGGVISPLIANLYMNRFLKYWRQSGGAGPGRRMSSTARTTSSSSAGVMRPRPPTSVLTWISQT